MANAIYHTNECQTLTTDAHLVCPCEPCCFISAKITVGDNEASFFFGSYADAKRAAVHFRNLAEKIETLSDEMIQ